jgi:putative membrane protein insertion efficiency factor
MKHVCIWLIKLYQKWISPLKRPCCRFYPTCSAYALEAFQKRGFFVGLGLSVWRFLRCNPFGKPGHDPVPEKKKRQYPKVPLSRNREDQKTQEGMDNE